jgi:ribonuclease P/MRP protein subunit POP1
LGYINSLIFSQLHHAGAPVSQPIAPVNYMWRPSCLRNRENGNNEHISGGCNETQISDACSSHRQLWVWIHASAFSEGYDALKFACQKQVHGLSSVLMRKLRVLVTFWPNLLYIYLVA